MTERFFRVNILPMMDTYVVAVINFLKSNVDSDFCFLLMIWRLYSKIRDGFVWKCENKLRLNSNHQFN